MSLPSKLEILFLDFKSRVIVTFELFEAGDGGASEKSQLEDVYLLQVHRGACPVKKFGLLEYAPLDVVGGWEEDVEAKAANDVELLFLLVLYSLPLAFVDVPEVVVVRCRVVLVLHYQRLRARPVQGMRFELGDEVGSTLADLHDLLQVHGLFGSESADDLLHGEAHVHPQLRIDGVVHDADEARGQCPACQHAPYLC
jgi:hypothetical protein